MGEVVFVDNGETDKVPAAVREALNKESGAIPKVALSNATGDKVYGTASHKALVGGLDKALRDAKRAMRDDAKGAAPKPATADSKTAPASDSETPAAPGDIKVTADKNGEKNVTGAPLEQWKNSKGTAVIAKVTRVSKTKLTLLTDKGKTVTINQADLAAESYSRLQEILNP
jgi:hypothetical protein